MCVRAGEFHRRTFGSGLCPPILLRQDFSCCFCYSRLALPSASTPISCPCLYAIKESWDYHGNHHFQFLVDSGESNSDISQIYKDRIYVCVCVFKIFLNSLEISLIHEWLRKILVFKCLKIFLLSLSCCFLGQFHYSPRRCSACLQVSSSWGLVLGQVW